MNPIFYFLIPIFIATFFIGIHWILEVNSWQREIKRDEKRDKMVDRMLSDDPGCENEEVLHPSKWEGFYKMN